MSRQQKKFKKLRQKLLGEKLFFYALFSEHTKQTKARLSVASALQIKLLIKILHYLASGAISIKGKQFQKIKSARKVATLTRIADKSQLKEKLSEALSDQKKFVAKFSSIYPALLHPMFVAY